MRPFPTIASFFHAMLAPRWSVGVTVIPPARALTEGVTVKNSEKSETDKKTSMAFSPADSKIYALLVNRHGPLMDIDELAAALRRTKKNIQSALSSRRPEQWALALKEARVHQGRRVLFKTPLVAQIIETDMPEARNCVA